MKSLLLVAVLATLLAGCASDLSGSTFKRDEARREQTVRLATVESVRYVKLEGTRTGVGAAAGGVVGGIAGSGVGHGKGSSIASVLGAVAGGVAGQAIEEKTTQKDALEITVRLSSGELRAIVQEAGGDSFKPGDQVRLLGSGGTTRVSK